MLDALHGSAADGGTAGGGAVTGALSRRRRWLWSLFFLFEKTLVLATRRSILMELLELVERILLVIFSASAWAFTEPSAVDLLQLLVLVALQHLSED